MTKKSKKVKIQTPDQPNTETPKILNDPAALVAGFLIEGHSNIDIIEFLESRQLTPSAATSVLEEALKKFVKASKMPAEVRRGWCIEALRHLYQKMESSGDYSGARQAVSEIARLADIVPGKNKAPQDPDDTKDEIDQYVEMLLNL